MTKILISKPCPLPDIVLIIKHCPFCHRKYQKEFNADAYRKWQNGMNVQDAFPDRSADDREFLITGICPECWDKMEVED